MDLLSTNMNKLTFSSGGQPVYLDDLQSLQLQIDAVLTAILDLLQFSPLKCFTSKEVIRSDFNGMSVVGSGRLFYRTDAGKYIYCDFSGASFDPEVEVGELYLCVNHENANERLFQDGQIRTCNEVYSAYWSVSPSGNEANIKFKDIPTFKVSPNII